MLRKYIGDLAFIQVLNLLVKPIWILVIDAAVQEALPQEVYGNYFALYNTSLLFFIILDLGLNNFNITEVAHDRRKINAITGGIIGLKLILSVLYILIVLAVGFVLGFSSSEFQLLFVLCVLQILTSFNQFLRSIVASMQRFKIDGVFMVLDRILVIVFVSILLWSGVPNFKLTIHSFAYAQVLSLLLVLFALFFFLRSQIATISVSLRLHAILPIIKKSWPFALLVTLMGLYTYVDGVMLKVLAGDAAAGIYALGYRFYFALLMFASVFSNVLLPLFSKNLQNEEMLLSISSFTTRLLLFGGLVASLLAGSYGLELISFINPSKATPEAASVLVFLLVGFLGASLTLVYGALLTAAKDLKWLNRFAAITVIVNLTLNTLLIPLYTAQGAAIATMISQLAFGIVCLIVCARKYKFSISILSLLKPFFGTLLLALIIFVGKQYVLNLYVHFLIIAPMALYLAYLFKLYQVKDIKTLF